MQVDIITIGDEILQGHTVDTNSSWIAQQLWEFNLPILHIESISDRRDEILQALDRSKGRADIILVTGGLGPTKDDVTKATIAEYFQTRLIRNQQVLDHVKAIFARMNREMPLINEGQADVLECAEVLFNDYGTAPGMWVESEGKVFVFMPGVPFEMKYLMRTYVIPKLMQHLGDEVVLNAFVLTAGIGESHLAEKIADIEASLPPHIHLAFLPNYGMVKLRLTGEGSDESGLKRQLYTCQQRLVERLSSFVVATDNSELVEVLIHKLQSNNLTVGTAESCTGGNIAHQITAVAGSSSVFQGGIVSYSNAVKHAQLKVSIADLEEFGAVSEPVVIQMAKGAVDALDVDFAMATTGVAGPGGGTEEKPVGTVWVAVANRDRVWSKKFQFHHDRSVNIERATMQALLMLWRALEELGF